MLGNSDGVVVVVCILISTTTIPRAFSKDSMGILQENCKDTKREVLDFGKFNTFSDYILWNTIEENVASALTRKLHLLRLERRMIQTYLKDYHQSSGKALESFQNENIAEETQASVVGKSAILGHRMASRYTGMIEDIKKLVNGSAYKHVEKDVLKALHIRSDNPDEKCINGQQHWIGKQDLFMSMNGYLQIQEIHDCLPEKVVMSKWESSSLKPAHCAEVGAFALSQGWIVKAIQWLEYAKNLNLGDSIPEMECSTHLLNLLLIVAAQEHNFVHHKNLTKTDESEEDFFKRLNMYSHPLRELNSSKMRATIKEMTFSELTQQELGELGTSNFRFMNTCKGNIVQAVETRRKLKCYYEHNMHPYLLINPVKTEILSESPPIVQSYELLGPKRIKQIIKDNQPNVRLPPGYKAGFYKFIGKVTFVSTSIDFSHPTSIWIHTLGNIVNGFGTVALEQVKYAESTYGRFNKEHTDEFGAHHAESVTFGDRQATTLYFLEEPEYGGETAFCEGGVTARPVKGSAVTFPSFYKNGTLRKDVVHGGCPVRWGNKIILIYWTRAHANWNSRQKCSVNRLE